MPKKKTETQEPQEQEQEQTESQGPTLLTAVDVRNYLLSTIPNWNRDLVEARKSATGSQYIEITGRLEFLQFLHQAIAGLPIKEK